MRPRWPARSTIRLSPNVVTPSSARRRWKRSGLSKSSCAKAVPLSMTRNIDCGRMPELIAEPAVVEVAGTKPKGIREYGVRVSPGEGRVSVARMTYRAGWEEPGQRPELAEYTVV